MRVGLVQWERGRFGSAASSLLRAALAAGTVVNRAPRMQITANTTQMPAELACAADHAARDHVVVVIKGTFIAGPAGELTLAEEQQQLVTVDEHFGAPEGSSVRFESEFALQKPFTDVIVVGHAIAPKGERVSMLPVRLEVQGRSKDLIVHGDRHWVHGSVGTRTSAAVPFTHMPITFERAWGGKDDSRGPQQVLVEPRNPVGVGYHPYRHAAEVDGLPVPNVEAMDQAICSPSGRYSPVGFGCIGRGWQPRLALAGTYDDRWRNEYAPFLPPDFDPRHFQCAPEDQQFEHFKGGEQIRCTNMAEQRIVSYLMPAIALPVNFRFAEKDLERHAVLDTVTLEPHRARATLVWRCSAPLGKKLTAIREILVGAKRPRVPRSGISSQRAKPHFAGLGAAMAALRHGKGKP